MLFISYHIEGDVVWYASLSGMISAALERISTIAQIQYKRIYAIVDEKDSYIQVFCHPSSCGLVAITIIQ